MPNTKQDRVKVAGGQDHEADKTGATTRDGLPTGKETAGHEDVADPHPRNRR